MLSTLLTVTEPGYESRQLMPKAIVCEGVHMLYGVCRDETRAEKES